MAYRIKVTMKMIMIMMMMITITIMITTTIFRLKWIVIGLISQRVVSFDAHEHLGLFPHQMHQSYYITSCHIISYHIISCHIARYDYNTYISSLSPLQRQFSTGVHTKYRRNHIVPHPMHLWKAYKQDSQCKYKPDKPDKIKRLIYIYIYM